MPVAIRFSKIHDVDYFQEPVKHLKALTVAVY